MSKRKKEKRMLNEAMTLNKAAEWLKEQRTAMGWSQRELARRMEINNATISEAEKGYASPETWKAVALFFKVPPERILSLSGFLDLPTKDELIEQINHDLFQMSAEERSRVAKIVKALRLGGGE
jgi:transcriptional regulator with XRE-family HTH domain